MNSTCGQNSYFDHMSGSQNFLLKGMVGHIDNMGTWDHCSIVIMFLLHHIQELQ